MGADISTQKKCYIFFQSKPVSFTINMKFSYIRLRGATVARLTPDQKAACSNHVGVICFLFYTTDLSSENKPQYTFGMSMM